MSTEDPMYQGFAEGSFEGSDVLTEPSDDDPDEAWTWNSRPAGVARGSC